MFGQKKKIVHLTIQGGKNVYKYQRRYENERNWKKINSDTKNFREFPGSTKKAQQSKELNCRRKI